MHFEKLPYPFLRPTVPYRTPDLGRGETEEEVELRADDRPHLQRHVECLQRVERSSWAIFTHLGTSTFHEAPKFTMHLHARLFFA